MTVRFVCIADTHTRHRELSMPDGDVLLVAGDFTGTGTVDEIEDFSSWLSTLSYPVKIVVAGNHDLLFEDAPKIARRLLKNAVYLEDAEYILSPSDLGRNSEVWNMRIYGSPWQPRYYDWAFNLNRNSNELRSKWRKIPAKVDVLITHTPPHGILDSSPRGDRAGCELLRAELRRIQPRLHVFGHLHKGHGVLPAYAHYGAEPIFVNAAMCNENYFIDRTPIVVDLDPSEQR